MPVNLDENTLPRGAHCTARYRLATTAVIAAGLLLWDWRHLRNHH